MACSLCFLIQFIKSQSLWFFDVISWIFLSKNMCFAVFTIFLKSFCYDLKLGSGCNSGKDLSKSKEDDQLVKCKDTEMYLHYIYL